jgi:hypothetical protein
MGRQFIPLADGTLVVVGYDRPFDTWFAQWYDDQDDNKPPRAVVGYSRFEQDLLREERPDAYVGPFPVSFSELAIEMARAGMPDEAVAMAALTAREE